MPCIVLWQECFPGIGGGLMVFEIVSCPDSEVCIRGIPAVISKACSGFSKVSDWHCALPVLFLVPVLSFSPLVVLKPAVLGATGGVSDIVS